ncbi:MAG: Txe/YoeB family addiction module toxin [Oscillospiraceae bacterium]|nr:Txe/YoeB family addiction module toxin [Oscillospiraceae bacterium]
MNGASWKVVYSKQAKSELPLLKATKLLRKTKELIEVLKENPLKTPPPYEKLLGNMDGKYSRRINLKHRLVYEILPNTQNLENAFGEPFEGLAYIVSMWTHYE